MGSGLGDTENGLSEFDATGGRLCVSVQQAGRLLGISRGLAYELARRHELPAVRLGRRLVVPMAALANMLEKRAAQ